MKNKYDPMTVDSIIWLGKHKGKTIKEVMGIDCQYLKWAINNIKHFDVEENLKQQILDKVINKITI